LVREALIEATRETRRIHVLLQDEQLGRIALRMVDRAGLIHAVVRTDSPRAAQLVSDSLPALIESLSQRGLAAAWTSAPGDGLAQQADPRQGQSRRPRSPAGAAPGRRGARPSDAVFRVEAR
jgi:flagellar hook-length control protein FliK